MGLRSIRNTKTPLTIWFVTAIPFRRKNETDQVINNLVSSAQFDRTEAEYGGYYTYSAVIENTSKIQFGNVSLLLALYDADGVKVGGDFCQHQFMGGR